MTLPHHLRWRNEGSKRCFTVYNEQLIYILISISKTIPYSQRRKRKDKEGEAESRKRRKKKKKEEEKKVVEFFFFLVFFHCGYFRRPFEFRNSCIHPLAVVLG